MIPPDSPGSACAKHAFPCPPSLALEDSTADGSAAVAKIPPPRRRVAADLAPLLRSD